MRRLTVAGDLLGRHVGDLALELPLARRLHAPGGLGDAEVEHARHAVGADEDVLRRDVAVDDAERLALLARRLVRGVQAVEDVDDRSAATDARRRRSPCAGALARSRRASDSPCTYSMTRNSSPSVATTSSVGTTLGCRIRAASRASSRNIETNSGSLASCGCRRLMATVRENPAGPLAAEVHGRHPARRDLAVQRVPPDPADGARGGLPRGHRPILPPQPATGRRGAATARPGPRLLAAGDERARHRDVVQEEIEGIRRRVRAGRRREGIPKVALSRGSSSAVPVRPEMGLVTSSVSFQACSSPWGLGAA